jgi:hypothetical protein
MKIKANADKFSLAHEVYTANLADESELSGLHLETGRINEMLTEISCIAELARCNSRKDLINALWIMQEQDREYSDSYTFTPAAIKLIGR